MSDNINSAIVQPIGIDVLTPLQRYAALAQTQAQQQLTQRQIAGADITNQANALSLLKARAMAAPFLPAGAVPGYAGAAPAAAITSRGMLPPAAGMSGPPSAEPTAATHSPGMPQQGQQLGSVVSPYGAIQTIYGVPLPWGVAQQVAFNPDKPSVLKDAMEERRQRLQELLTQPDWQQGVTQAYQEGWMDPQHYSMLLGNPNVRQQVLNGLADPNTYMTTLEKYSGQGLQLNQGTGQPEISQAAVAAKSSLAGAEAGAKAGYDIDTRTMPVGTAKDGSMIFAPVTNTKANFARQLNGGGAAPTGADLADPTKATTLDDYAANVASRESGAAGVGAKNPMPGQTASGTSGFTDGTWSSFMAAQHPEMTAGKTPAQISAMKTDPAVGGTLGTEAAKWYAGQNAPALQEAGLPVNTLTLGLAHAFGANGAAGIMRAPSTAPIAQVVGPDVMAANPNLRGKTVGQVIGDTFAAYGARPIAAGGAADAGAPGGGIVSGPQVLSPTQQANLDIGKSATIAQNTNDIEAMGKHRDDLAGAADSATKNNALIDQMRVEGQGFDHGSFTDTYQGIKKDLSSVFQALGQKMPDSVADWEAFQKNAGALARSAASALSPRVGVQELQLVQKYLPSATMSSQAFSRIADQTQGLNDYQIAKNAAAANFTGRPAQFEAAFNANVTPATFVVHRMSDADMNTFAKALKQTPEGRETWNRIVAGTKYADEHGLFDAVGGEK